MKITLVMPSIGRRPECPNDYIGSWQMEPLALAVLAGVTPPEHEVIIADDRVESMPFDEPTDLVAINAEAFTAMRAYQIADAFRARGVPVVLGGFHPSLVPEEAKEHADTVVVGEAERIWPQLLEDVASKNLQEFYRGEGRVDLSQLKTKRSIFEGKGYLPVRLVESGRGCNYRCNFCSVTEFFGHRYIRRPLDNLVAELETLESKRVFFVDDNIAADPQEARAFFKALKPLGITWVSQMTIDAARDTELLDILVDSGCLGLLIGFESLSEKNLAQMNKSVNTRAGGYDVPLQNLRDRAIKIYATFLLGYDDDDKDTFQRTLDFSMEHKFFMAAFNHLVPFPGTPLYDELEKDGRLLYDKWWLDSRYRFGGVAFNPKGITADELDEGCMWMRRRFYEWKSIFKRVDFGNNVCGWSSLAMFFNLNRMLQREVSKKKDLPLGVSEAIEPQRPLSERASS